MPRHSCCEVRVMQLHDILLLRTSASLHSVSVGAKPLSTGQCAPCRRLYNTPRILHFRKATQHQLDSVWNHLFSRRRLLMTLGEKLYTLRTKQNMTQEQLAEKLQVSPYSFEDVAYCSCSIDHCHYLRIYFKQKKSLFCIDRCGLRGWKPV